jgi:hypothetical protein
VVSSFRYYDCSLTGIRKSAGKPVLLLWGGNIWLEPVAVAITGSSVDLEAHITHIIQQHQLFNNSYSFNMYNVCLPVSRVELVAEAKTGGGGGGGGPLSTSGEARMI